MVPNFGASIDTIDSLVTLLENSHLSFKPDGCVPDDNFTAPLIEKAFESNSPRTSALFLANA